MPCRPWCLGSWRAIGHGPGSGEGIRGAIPEQPGRRCRCPVHNRLAGSRAGARSAGRQAPASQSRVACCPAGVSVISASRARNSLRRPVRRLPIAASAQRTRRGLPIPGCAKAISDGQDTRRAGGSPSLSLMACWTWSLAWPGVHRDDVLLAAEEHEDHRPEASVDQCSVSHPHRSTRFARSGSTACPIRTPLPGIVLPVL